MAAKTDNSNTDLLMRLRARKRRSGNASTALKGNRDGKISTLVTEAHSNGISTIQAEKRLEGWTRVHKGRVTADVTPVMVSGMIEGRAARNQELAANGIEHDVDYLNLVVLASTGLKPSRDARLGGRYYVIDVEKLADIPEAVYLNMLDDVDDDAVALLTEVRPVGDDTEESESDDAATE